MLGYGVTLSDSSWEQHVSGQNRVASVMIVASNSALDGFAILGDGCG
jgi:hypothetical protein